MNWILFDGTIDHDTQDSQHCHHKAYIHHSPLLPESKQNGKKTNDQEIKPKHHDYL